MTVAFEKEELRELILRRAEEVLRAPSEPAFHKDSVFAPVLRMGWAVMRNLPLGRFRADMEAAFEEMYARFQLLLAHQAETWNNDAADYRLLCVSERNDSTLMWSHYADYHKGVVLCLRAIEELAAKPVRYSESIPVLARLHEWVDQLLGMTALDHSDQFYKQAYTKHIDWGYEREWRVMTRSHPTDAGDHEDTLFYHEEVEAVYLGCRITADDRDVLLRMLNGDWSHVRVFQAFQLPRSFALDLGRCGNRVVASRRLGRQSRRLSLSAMGTPTGCVAWHFWQKVSSKSG
jgi:hypothetical protein